MEHLSASPFSLPSVLGFDVRVEGADIRVRDLGSRVREFGD